VADPLDVELVELHLRRLYHPDGSFDRCEVVLQVPLSEAEYAALMSEVHGTDTPSCKVTGHDAADHAYAFLPDHLMGLLLEET